METVLNGNRVKWKPYYMETVLNGQEMYQFI